MSVGLWLAIIFSIIGFALLAGRICHIGDLERNPLDIDQSKPLNVLSFVEKRRRFESSRKE